MLSSVRQASRPRETSRVEGAQGPIIQMRVVFAAFYPPGSFEKAQSWAMPGDERRTASSFQDEEAEDMVNLTRCRSNLLNILRYFASDDGLHVPTRAPPWIYLNDSTNLYILNHRLVVY